MVDDPQGQADPQGGHRRTQRKAVVVLDPHHRRVETIDKDAVARLLILREGQRCLQPVGIPLVEVVDVDGQFHHRTHLEVAVIAADVESIPVIGRGCFAAGGHEDDEKETVDQDAEEQHKPGDGNAKADEAERQRIGNLV
jgi:hypothetical protein